MDQPASSAAASALASLSISWSVLKIWPLLSKAAPAYQPYANMGAHPGDPLYSLGISSASVAVLAYMYQTGV